MMKTLEDLATLSELLRKYKDCIAFSDGTKIMELDRLVESVFEQSMLIMVKDLPKPTGQD